LLSGFLTKNYQRKIILGLLTVFSSMFIFTNGITNSFAIIFAMRFLHAVFSSVSGPLSFSIVADYFPPERRGTANALLSTGSYIGIAFSSISILLIK
jgi:MFS family permease